MAQFEREPVPYVHLEIGVPSETWEGDGALMTCTWSSVRVHKIEWYKRKLGSEKQRVFLFVSSENVHRAENDLLDTSSKPRAVGQLVGLVYHLYINKTVLSDDAVYSCALSGTEDSTRLLVNGE